MTTVSLTGPWGFPPLDQDLETPAWRARQESYPISADANSPDRVIDCLALLRRRQNSLAESGSRLVRQGKAARCVDIGNRLPKKPATR